MKNLFYLLAIAAVFTLASCHSFLDDPEPAQSLPSATAFTTARDIETGLIGAYDAVQSSRLFACNVIMVSDIMADNGEWRGSFPSMIEIFNQAITPSNPEISGMWQLGYRAINASNLVIKALGDVNDPALTPDLANRLRGEALFIRAATMFEMVRLYGRPWGMNPATDLGIPVLTSPVATSDDITFPARNTVREVYERVIEDFTEAIGLLPASSAHGRGRATRGAAQAYLAAVYFQQGDYINAANFAGDVLNGPYSLTVSPVDFFINEGSSEEIWAVVNTPQDNPGVNGSLPTFHHINGRGGDVVVDPDLIENGYNKIISASQAAELAANNLTAVDLRFTTLTSSTNPPTVNIEKYEDFTNNADDAPILRMAEFYLMRAEALARNTNSVNPESIDLLNIIRQRAIRVTDANGNPSAIGSQIINYEPSDFANVDELIEAIILERRVEMAFEGNRFYDLLRLQRPVKGTPWNANNLRWPLPQRDLDANASLEQNPDY
jgi:hypothetical protein